MLVAELSKELAGLYPDSHGGDGSGAFKMADVLGPRAAFVVVWQNDEPVGCGALRPLDDPDVGEVKRMYVRPQFRGLGLGKRLLAHLAGYARQQGAGLLRLETGIYQTAAIHLYERYGFERIPPFGDYREDPLSLYYEFTLPRHSGTTERSDGVTG